MKLNKIPLILFLTLISVQTNAERATLRPSSQPVVKFTKNKKRTLQEYNEVHKKYYGQLCKPGSKGKFWKYMQQFSGNGFYVPTTVDKKLDTVTVNRFIPELERKKRWIDSLPSTFAKKKDFKKEIEQVEKFQETLKQLLEYKRQYFELDSPTKRESARIKSKYLFIKFKNEFKDLLEKIPFLLSYRHPIDHFDLRLTYDKYKNRDTVKTTQKANEVNFYRKIVQDGAQNPNNSRSDTFLRTAIDTLTIELSKEWDIIPENIRYDLNFVLGAIIFHLEKGAKYLKPRMEEWSGRTQRMIDYYRSLKKNKVKINGKIISVAKLIKEKDEARFNLKRFSLKKQAEAYRFWKKQPEHLRALFVIETILYNEVGALDGRDALERKDVAQVVINRLKMPEYNSILMTDSIFPYLSKSEMPIKTNPWLNVLFKEGEFSFTYFFIGGNLNIFCPEDTSFAKRVRRNNLNLGYDLLQNPNYEFEAVRYFSRHSMLGRIDMAQIWNKFQPMEERAGLAAPKPEVLMKKYSAGEYEYLYHFVDNEGRKFKVLAFDDRAYVKANDKLEFYKYRNPHFFRYFKKR